MVMGDGVTVVARNAEQSALAVATCAGPCAVPVTARAQLSALHAPGGGVANTKPVRERITAMRNCMMRMMVSNSQRVKRERVKGKEQDLQNLGVGSNPIYFQTFHF
jgi:hypothetical protein